MRGAWIILWLSWTSVCLAGPAESISAFRHEHGLSAVRIDPTLTRLAREQAEAMAAANKLDHGIRAPFASRIAAYSTDRAAENVAMGNTTFPATFEQWKNSAGHRSNLLIRDVSRIGIASASSGGRTYWALILATAPKSRRPPRATAEAKSVDFLRVLKDSLRLQQ